MLTHGRRHCHRHPIYIYIDFRDCRRSQDERRTLWKQVKGNDHIPEEKPEHNASLYQRWIIINLLNNELYIRHKLEASTAELVSLSVKFILTSLGKNNVNFIIVLLLLQRMNILWECVSFNKFTSIIGTTLNTTSMQNDVL